MIIIGKTVYSLLVRIEAMTYFPSRGRNKKTMVNKADVSRDHYQSILTES